MKALNRQQRKAAIWKFVILYLITIILIALPFFLMDSFSNSQRSIIRDEILDDIKINEIDDLNKKIDDLNTKLGKARNNIPDGLNISTITSVDINKIYDSKKMMQEIKKIDLKRLKEAIED
jgi:hypothetical protein